MMRYGFNPWPALVFGLTGLFILFGLLLNVTSHSVPLQEVVDRGCARYHPQTGEFEWVDKTTTK